MKYIIILLLFTYNINSTNMKFGLEVENNPLVQKYLQLCLEIYSAINDEPCLSQDDMLSITNQVEGWVSLQTTKPSPRDLTNKIFEEIEEKRK